MIQALFIAASLLAQASSAQAPGRSVVFDVPLAKAKLTVHTKAGAASPDSVTYEGPKGHFLVSSTELGDLSRENTCSPILENVYGLSNGGLTYRTSTAEAEATLAWSAPAAVSRLETAISELRGKAKKEEAPDEFAARVASLKRRADAAEGLRQSLKLANELHPGYILDTAELDSLQSRLAVAAATIAASKSERVKGEAAAAAAAPSAEDPNPKATFYWRQRLALDEAARAVAQSEDSLRLLPVPQY
jgi:hypothetical protein